MVNSIFYIFTFFSIVGSIFVVSAKNPIRAVIAKVFTFFSVAVVWLTMQHEYLSLLLIVIYVGAILVMFLFVIMMLDIKIVANQRKVFYWPIAFLLCIFFIVILFFCLIPVFQSNSMPSYTGNTHKLGKTMFSEKYLYAFELAGVILLTAMIAAITLTFRGKRPGNKLIDPKKQISVDPDYRISMVNINSSNNIIDKRGNDNDK